MRPEPLLHLRAAIKRGCQPDERDLGWLAQNLSHLDSLESEVQAAVQYLLNDKDTPLIASSTVQKTL